MGKPEEGMSIVEALQHAASLLEKQGKQEPPKWTKIPDCECFQKIPVTRITTIDLTLNQLGPLIDGIFSDLCICSAGSYVFLGELLLVAASRVFAAGRDPTRDGQTLLDGSEQETMLRLIDDACFNAKERLVELTAFLARKHGN